MKYDFFKVTQDNVKKILDNHQLEHDCADADTFADFMLSIDKHSFVFAEKEVLYTYNYMLQKIVSLVKNGVVVDELDASFSIKDVKFEMHIVGINFVDFVS